MSMHYFMGELRCHAIQEAFELRSDESHASPASEDARISPTSMLFFFSFQSRKVRDLCRHATCEATRKQTVHCTLGGRLIIGQPLLSSNHAPCFDHFV